MRSAVLDARARPRRNRALNPCADASGLGFTSNNSAISTTARGAAVTGHPLGIATAAVMVPVDGAANRTIASIYNPDALGAATAARWLGAWIFTNHPTAQAVVRGPSAGPRMIPIPANTWVWMVSPTAFTGQGVIAVEVVTGGANATPDHFAYVTGVMAETEEPPLGVIAGSLPGCAWTGTPHRSESVGVPRRP